jgi:hypothetical protein
MKKIPGRVMDQSGRTNGIKQMGRMEVVRNGMITISMTLPNLRPDAQQSVSRP